MSNIWVGWDKELLSSANHWVAALVDELSTWHQQRYLYKLCGGCVKSLRVLEDRGGLSLKVDTRL